MVMTTTTTVVARSMIAPIRRHRKELFRTLHGIGRAIIIVTATVVTFWVGHHNNPVRDRPMDPIDLQLLLQRVIIIVIVLAPPTLTAATAAPRHGHQRVRTFGNGGVTVSTLVV